MYIRKQADLWARGGSEKHSYQTLYGSGMKVEMRLASRGDLVALIGVAKPVASPAEAFAMLNRLAVQLVPPHRGFDRLPEVPLRHRRMALWSS
jgi:hypothetical protein